VTGDRTDPLGGWSSLPADSVAVNFSGHARERFAERVRDGVTRAAVRRELSLMLAAPTVTTKRPEWMLDSEHDAAAYLMLGPDVAAPLVRHADGELVATTVTFRGLVGPERRAGRNERKAKTRPRRRRGRTAERYGVSRRRSGPDASEWDET
jgi:hypothetical protein